MERFSNNYIDVHNEVKTELSDIELTPEESCVTKYMEMPWFPGNQFAIYIIRDDIKKNYRVTKKSWDSKYDTERFSTRVFNLDRLCIQTHNFQLSEEKQIECKTLLKSITNLPETLQDEGYIVLDGINYELKIKTDYADKLYNWKIANDNIRHFTPLINFLLLFSKE